MSYGGNRQSGHGYGQRVRSFQASRSKRSKVADSRKRAPIANSEKQWLSDPRHFDLEGIDTPNSSKTFVLKEVQYGQTATVQAASEKDAKIKTVEKFTGRKFDPERDNWLFTSLEVVNDLPPASNIAPVVAKETKDSVFFERFPPERFYIIRWLNDGGYHMYPQKQGDFPEGYSTKAEAEAFVKKWAMADDAQIVTGNEAAAYPVPKRW